MQTSAPLSCVGIKAVTGAAAKLTTNTDPLCNGVSIKAFATNTHPVYVGDSTVTVGTGYELSAGQEHTFKVVNPSTLYVIGTDGTVCFEGT